MAFDLAALSLQADVGDYYDQSNNNYFEPHNYVPPDVSFNSVCVCGLQGLQEFLQDLNFIITQHLKLFNFNKILEK